MNVLWVLFLVLLNTIGNQGEPNQTAQEDPLLSIVSLRDEDNCHICTGSLISAKWILSALGCFDATHFLHGLREYGNCNETTKGIELAEMNPLTRICVLYEIKQEFNKTVPYLIMPESSNSELPQTRAAVVGWSFDNDKRKFVMKTIADVNIEDALSGRNKEFFQAFREISKGSPLIVGNIIYGFVRLTTCRFDNFLPDVNEIRSITNITS